MKKIIIFISAILLAACQTAPNGLETTNQTLTALSQVNKQDADCKCRQIRVGGRVLQATALDNNKTRIEVLSYPLSSYSAKPRFNQESDGRFIAIINRFVDPENLTDHYISVVGQLDGIEKGKIDKATYDYPHIAVTNYKIWEPDDLIHRTRPRVRVGVGFGGPHFNFGMWGY